MVSDEKSKFDQREKDNKIAPKLLSSRDAVPVPGFAVRHQHVLNHARSCLHRWSPDRCSCFMVTLFIQMVFLRTSFSVSGYKTF